MFIAESAPGRSVIINGKEYLFFSGTAYLGMNSNPAFHQLVMEGMHQYGSNYSSSRKSNFQLKIFDEAEDFLANWVGAPACMTVSSGYMAGQLVARTLEGRGKFVYAPAAHPAMWRNAADFSGGDFHEWANGIAETVCNSVEEDIIILTNSIDALYSIEYNFDWVKDLPSHKNITLVVDDSHGIGLLGKEGRGIYALLPEKDNVRKIVCCSIGKALGLPGGAIFADEDFLDEVLNGPWFGTSSPMNPSYLFAFVHGQPIYKEALSALRRNARQLAEIASQTGHLKYIPDYPVFYSSDPELYDRLLNQDILISSFPYPLPTDKVVNRIVLNSQHTMEDLQKLEKAILGDFGN
jgi:8-amino-7-oxononanoate synthase